jgi:PleD family two-component response regulator
VPADPTPVITTDIDLFDGVNDTQGDQAGDDAVNYVTPNSPCSFLEG